MYCIWICSCLFILCVLSILYFSIYLLCFVLFFVLFFTYVMDNGLDNGYGIGIYGSIFNDNWKLDIASIFVD